MEPEFRDTSGRRGKVIIAVGLILAIAAGGGAFYLVNQATQAAGQGPLQKVALVVAKREIPARQAIVSEDVEVREVPVDQTNANGAVADATAVIGRIPAVTIFAGQLVTQNLLASAQAGDEFSILGPQETVSPTSEAWRAVSVTVPDELAVGGVLKAGQTVDIFVTAVVVVPQSVADSGRYMSDRSTKIVYQDVVILARKDQFYIVRAPVAMAEELAHLQAVGTSTLSMVLRPEIDQRPVDATLLGETTNRIIEKYGLPIPEVYPSGTGPLATLPPIPSPTPFPSQGAGGAASPAPSGSAAP